MRNTIKRELENTPLEDIEKERGNGEVIYKITAEPDGKNEVKLYIAPDGRLLRKEKEED